MARTMVQWVKPLPAALASQMCGFPSLEIGASSNSVLLLAPFPADVTEKAAVGGPISCAPGPTWEIQMKLLAPFFLLHCPSL